jgi:hypothetical protein
MPYIKPGLRGNLDVIAEFQPNDPGELNYIFTVIARNYFREHHNYQGINDILGALEGAKQEFYRRVAVPYEDKKIKENGDVY